MGLKFYVNILIVVNIIFILQTFNIDIQSVHEGSVQSCMLERLSCTNIFILCRLSCYDEFMELIPEPFLALLPPEPVPQFKFSPDAECKW